MPRTARVAPGGMVHHMLNGAVYLFKCYDGEHFAKMQVLEIIDNERDYMRLIADMARE